VVSDSIAECGDKILLEAEGSKRQQATVDRRRRESRDGIEADTPKLFFVLCPNMWILHAFGLHFTALVTLRVIHKINRYSSSLDCFRRYRTRNRRDNARCG